MMKITRISKDEFGQMLLATGIVLLMSLLSMAIFSVKLAGMSMPYEPNSTGVLDVSQEVLATIEPVTQARYEMWVEQGIDEEELSSWVQHLRSSLLCHRHKGTFHPCRAPAPSSDLLRRSHSRVLHEQADLGRLSDESIERASGISFCDWCR